MTNDTDSSPKQYAIYAWLVWGLAASYFFCDYFARVSPSVMVPDLIHTFKISASGLGNLSAYFYYPYIAMQIPVGLLVDRFSMRGLLTIMCLITAVGCYLFGQAHVLSVAELGRFLIGFSAAFAFVAALKLASVWFPASRLGLLAGLTQALGMLGAAVGEAPVSLLVQSIGWRASMFVMTAVFVILAFFIYLIVRDAPKSMLANTQKRKTEFSLVASLKCVLSNPQSWLNATYAGLVFAPTAAFAELWGVSFLERVHGMSANSAAFANGLIFVGWGLGGPISGWLSDHFRSRKPIMYFSAILSTVFLSIVLFVPSLSYTGICAALFLFGVCNTGVGISYAVATEINPHKYAGTSIAFANMASIIIGAALQPVIGWLLEIYSGHLIAHDISAYAAHDFQKAMFVLPVCTIVALFLTYTIRETHCHNLSLNLSNEASCAA